MKPLTEDELSKFDPLTEAYNKLVECKNTLNVLGSQVKQDFQKPDDIEKGYYFSNPINVDYELEKLIHGMKEKITDQTRRYLDSRFNNPVIDHYDVEQFVGIHKSVNTNEDRPTLQEPFTARAVIQYIENKYADEETITLTQLRGYASQTLPHEPEYPYAKASKPEHIKVINKTGIELGSNSYYSGHKDDPTAAVIKLTHIKLNHTLPSQAEHHEINYNDTYSDDKIKSLRRYKNGKLKIIFHKEEDMETIRKLLVGCDD